MSAGRKNRQSKVDYCTPPKYVEAIMEFFDGKLDLDPCSNLYSSVPADNEIFLPFDGLKEEWAQYKSIFVNPPYGRDSERKTSIYDWIHKGLDTGSEILYLIPVATNTSHFKEVIFKYFTGICFLEDTRLKFWSEGKELKKGCPMACCMVYIGKNYGKFEKVFGKYGKCFKI